MRLALGLGLNDFRRAGTPTPTPTPTAPNITSSSISGTAEDGQVLTANRTATGYPAPTFAYQWQKNGTNISGQTAQTITLNESAMSLANGDTISCEITATNSEGSDSAEPTIAYVSSAEPTPTTLDTGITPPVLSLAVPYDTYPIEIDAVLDETVAVGDWLQTQYDDDIRIGSPTTLAMHQITSGEASANAASIGLSAISSGTNYIRQRVVRTDGTYSNWSNTLLHGEAVDSTPATFTFTDVTGATLSTVYESNTITLSGFNQPVAISVSGGEYAVNTGGGFGSYTTSVGTAYPGDQVKVRHTSSASNSTATNTTLTVGGVSDTYTTTTVAAAVSLPSSGLILRLDADDTSTLFQTITGTTAPADGQPIGTWNDKSGNGFHLTAAANDTTRPTYRTNSGLPYVEFDGTNDILRRLAALGMWDAGNASGLTVAIALRTTNATHSSSGLVVMGEGRGSVSNNPIYSPMTTIGASTAQMVAQIRNDAATNLHPSQISTTGLDGTDNVLIVTDTGSQLIGYDDGTAGTTRTYTRSGTLTLDRFALGGLQRSTTSGHLAMRVHAVAIWNRILDSSERAQVNTYMGSKQGKAL